MAAVRRAEASRNGDLTSGSGVVSAATSGAFTSLPVTWRSRTEERTEESDGRTSPEELVAAAHASCYCMALSAGLGRAGTPPESLEVSAEVTFDKMGDGWKITSSRLMVVGSVPGADTGGFQSAAEAAKDGFLISGALKGNVELSVEATLVS